MLFAAGVAGGYISCNLLTADTQNNWGIYTGVFTAKDFPQVLAATHSRLAAKIADLSSKNDTDAVLTAQKDEIKKDQSKEKASVAAEED